MNISLKISNIKANDVELLIRLKKIKSPGKKKLIENIVGGNWLQVYEELLYRMELYASEKVLNYTRADVNKVVNSIHKYGLAKVVKHFSTKVES